MIETAPEGRKFLTPADVSARVDKIARMMDDDKVAHGEKDRLYRDVLEAIANWQPGWGTLEYRALCQGPEVPGLRLRKVVRMIPAVSPVPDTTEEGPMSTADELRHAAKLLREVAEGATPGPWKHMCMGSEGCLVLRDSGTIRERGKGRVARFGCKEWKADHADAGYVAAMGPGVAKAVALLLDELAEHADHGSQGALAEDGLAVARALVPASVTESTEEN